MAILFNSGFEVTGFPEWDTHEFGQQTSNPKYSGRYALEATSNAMDFIGLFSTGKYTVYTRFYVRWKNLTTVVGSVDIMLIYGEGSEMFDIYLVTQTGQTKLVLWSALLGSSTGTTVLQSDRWYQIDVKVMVSTTAYCYLYLDEVLECSLSGNNNEAFPLTTIEFTASDYGDGYDNQYLDEVTVKDTQILQFSTVAIPYRVDKIRIGKSINEYFEWKGIKDIKFQDVSPWEHIDIPAGAMIHQHLHSPHVIGEIICMDINDLNTALFGTQIDASDHYAIGAYPSRIKWTVAYFNTYAYTQTNVLISIRFYNLKIEFVAISGIEVGRDTLWSVHFTADYFTIS